MGLLSTLIDIVYNDDSSNRKEPGFWKTLTGDMETEGKKAGYDQAAREYKRTFKRIEKEYKEAKQLIEEQTERYDNQSEDLINKLERLENRRKRLEQKRKRQVKLVAEQYGTSVKALENVARCSGKASFIRGWDNTSVIEGIYFYKKRKFIKARQQGYEEARDLYERKISALQNQLAQLKRQGDKKTKELLTMMEKILFSISEEQMKIADLHILLDEDK